MYKRQEDTGFKRVVITTVVAAAHVLILVVSKDLGSAVVFFVAYIVMLYVATKKARYALAGLAGGTLAAVVAYFLFNHVRQRVIVWQDPIAVSVSYTHLDVYKRQEGRTGDPLSTVGG